MNEFRLGAHALPPEETGSSGHNEGGSQGAPYDVMHSGRFILIDRRGHIRAYYDDRELDLDQVVGDIRALLR